MLNHLTPKAGGILLSEPFMMDQNFQRSVVLICERNEEGTIGLILNQLSTLLLSDVMEDFDGVEFKTYLGGPVGQESLQFIHTCPDKLNSGIELRDGLYWGGNFEALKLLVKEGQIDDKEVKFFIGYSGWAVGQLEEELKQNTWMVGNTYHNDLLFSNDEEELWKEAVISLGPRYAHIAQFPQNPMWN